VPFVGLGSKPPFAAVGAERSIMHTKLPIARYTVYARNCRIRLSAKKLEYSLGLVG